MVEVTLQGSLKAAAGRERLEVEAGNIRQLLDALAEAEPDLKPILDKGVTVSIDGQLYREAWFQEIPEGAEVFVMARMAGG